MGTSQGKGRRVILALLAVTLSSCAVVFPNTAATIAPATFADFWVAVCADLETLIALLGV